MIKFFRHIRQSLIMKNQTGKYFKYAIGEIILVVIGILIALQINNWNEKRKVVQDVSHTKIALKKELEKIIGRASYIIDIGYQLSEVLQEVKTTGELRTRSTSNSFYGKFELFDTFVFELNSDILTEFVSLEKSLTYRDEELLELAKSLKNVMKERIIWEAKATDLSLQRFKEFSDELPWFYNNDSLSNKLRSDYIKDNPIFKNKAIHYLNFQLNENVFYATEMRNYALILYWKLVNEEKAIDLKDILSLEKMRSFNRRDCNSIDNLKSEFLGFRNFFLIYNNSSETAVLQKYNKDKQMKLEIAINPKEYLNVSFNENDYLQHGKDCKSIYALVRNGFLIIEE